MGVEKVGENLNKAIKERGISRYKLADMMGLTYSSICRHMKGYLSDIGLFLKYCEVIGCDPRDMLKDAVDYVEPPMKRNLPSFYPYNLAEAIIGHRSSSDVVLDSSHIEDEVYKVYAPGLIRCINMLNPQEQYVIEERFGHGKTFETIGKELGVTRERIRQIEAKSLQKLNSPTFRKKYIMDTLDTAFKIAVERDFLKSENAELKKKLGVTEQISSKNMADIPIEILDLSPRPYHCLTRSGIRTLHDLSRMTVDDLQDIRSMGIRSMKEIITKAKAHGINIGY